MNVVDEKNVFNKRFPMPAHTIYVCMCACVCQCGGSGKVTVWRLLYIGTPQQFVCVFVCVRIRVLVHVKRVEH